MLFRSFNNAGTFTKATSTTQTVNGSITFNNSGQVTLAAGSGLLTMNGAGTDTGDYTVNTGATLDIAANRSWAATTDVNGAGTLRFIGGTTSVGGTYSIAGTGSTVVGGGTANFNTGAPVVFANALDFSAGTLLGSDAITTNGLNW